MSIKKLMLLATMAVSAMAFALPAAASASGGEIVNTTTGATAANGTVIQITGTNMKFGSEFGGFEKCILHGGAKVTNNTASTGEIVNGKVTTSTVSTCLGYGSFAGCKVDETATTVSGHITVTAHDVDLQNVVINGLNYGPECNPAFTHVDLTLSNVTSTPAAGSNTSLDDMTVSKNGNAIADLTDLGITTEVTEITGTLETSGSDIGKWQIATD